MGKSIFRACALAALALAVPSAPVVAQDSSYTPTSVWQFSYIKVLPGQFENYMDYLGANWRKELEFEKKEGAVVSYHVFSVNNPRENEPDVVLAVEYKDYAPVAMQLAIQKKIEAMMALDAHKSDTASAGRSPMRTLAGSMELQELKLK